VDAILSATEAQKVAARHLQNQEYALAERVCRRTLDAGETSPALVRLLAIALLTQKKVAEAAPYLVMALDGAPDPDFAIHVLPYLYDAGEWDAFITICARDVIERQRPARALKLRVMIGIAHFKMGREGMAAAQFRSCLDPIVSAGSPTPALDRGELDTLIEAAIGAGDEAAIARLAEIQTPGLDGRPRTMAINAVTPLRAWCEREGVSLQMLDVEQQVALPPADYRARECWVAAVPQGTVIAGWDWPVAPTGEVLDGGNYLPIGMMFGSCLHLHFPDIARVAHPWPAACVDVDADALFLSAPAGMHFGHWLVDFLPRLRAWRRPMKIAVPAALPAKHRDTLAAFGVTPGDLVECAPDKRYRFRSLTVVVTGNHKEPQPANVRFVQQGLAGPSAQKERRIFVHRADGTRGVANRAEFNALLAAYGFETVDLATKSIAEQRKMMAETGLVLGAHGSDLFCMYMTPPATDVVELVWDGIDDPVFAQSAAILGMRHHLVRCPGASSTALKVYKKDRDIVVDCNQLGERLNAIIDTRKMKAKAR